MSDIPFPKRPGVPSVSWLIRALDAVEAPTWGVFLGVYGGFGALTYWWQQIPVPVVMIVGAYLVCLQMHLAHEVLHGHPTRNRHINEALVAIPLSLWLPYPIYRDSHLAHHKVVPLTCPVQDPESFYVSPARWQQTSRAMRTLLIWNQSLAGRLTLGPILMVSRFLSGEAQRFVHGDRRYLGAWAVHALGAGLVLAWVVWVCGMPVWLYLAGIVYPSLSLALLRSFVEHQAEADQARRCAIVEGGPLTSLLFLNNNLHLVHHARPSLAWYHIPAAYRMKQQRWLARNGGYRYRSYWQVLRQHFFRPKQSPLWPGDTAP
jgi:fatty acid desaturase